jgi:hypothetical protein
MPIPAWANRLQSALARLSRSLESWPAHIVHMILCAWGAFLIARLLVFTWAFAVNLPFSDQWAFLPILLDGLQWRDLPAAFFFQHGPPRLGLGLALSLPMYELSHWNVRLDSMVIAWTLVMAGGLALRLRQLIPGPWTIFDAALMTAFWALTTYETIVITPVNSHSIFPLLLVMLIANVWIGNESRQRTVLLIVLTLCVCFTGFGLAAIPVLAVLLLLRLWREPRQWHATVAILLGLIFTVWVFLRDYHFVVGAGAFKFIQPNPLDYVRLGIMMFNYFFMLFYPGVRLTYYPLGIVFGGAVIWIAIQTMRALLPRPSRSASTDDRAFMEVCLMLCGTTLTFVTLTSYGRLQLGVYAGNTTRYMALMLPAFCGLYLWLRHSVTDTKRIVALGLLFLLCVRLVPETYAACGTALRFSNMKRCWFDVYQQSGSWRQANEAAQFPPVRSGTADQWQTLKDRRLVPFDSDVELSVLSRFVTKPCEHQR